jgi:hypothetical protein
MKHPPFVGVSPERSTREWMTRAGASLLAERIRDAWRRVGVDVQPVIEQGFSDDRRREAIFVVRLPTLVNGLPVR